MRFFKASLSLKPPLLSTREKYAASSKGHRPRHQILANGVSLPYHCCNEGRILLVAKSPVAPKIRRVALIGFTVSCVSYGKEKFFEKITVTALSPIVNLLWFIGNIYVEHNKGYPKGRAGISAREARVIQAKHEEIIFHAYQIMKRPCRLKVKRIFSCPEKRVVMDVSFAPVLSMAVETFTGFLQETNLLFQEIKQILKVKTRRGS
jgi:hypothetical protein